MDTVRGYGDGFGAMMVGRAASQRGFLLPERQYPLRTPPQVAGAAPLTFTRAITRQESSFDPRARSSADARGMMQFLPATASGVAAAAWCVGSYGGGVYGNRRSYSGFGLAARRVGQ